MIQYDIKNPLEAARREVFFDRNTNKLSYKDDYGIIVPFAPVSGGSSLPYWLEYLEADLTIWNNGKGNIASNTSFGEAALASNTSGGSNIAIGGQALNANTTQARNVAIGIFSARIATANDNTAVGANTLYSTTTGNSNVVIGSDAGWGLTTGSQNTLIGNNIYVTTGSSNVGVGLYALQNLTTGSRNVMVGKYTTANNSGALDTVVIGDSSSATFNSIVIGSNSTDNNFAGCIVIGKQAGATAANQFVVGSSLSPAGTVTTESLSSTRTWSVVINGTAYKILLA